ncbi:class I adenylate cyclase [Hahella sp. KA22]|uniref:class I adenylate cyclase n=1 Tax=Hahella sp. KA22 TaxID=1628392 RepID=UPI000FDDCD8E|nr:class I adenylate cyclase [Hahella sp. KA22]AZZ89900.1 class I adenylate cyclase [Hahella sp. KA22]QAY53269.1 class I adenylate cyclase [Hahella sp. KA22]
MSYRRSLNPDYTEGVDRKVLKTLCQRFITLVEHRLQRTRLALTPRQQVVLELLPLLFHVNHPLLPGYVSRTTPHRLVNYEPDKNVVAQAQRLSRSFNYREPARHHGDITSLYLMGSTGSIAHSGGSDFDVWLCHRSDLDATALMELQRKADLVCQWAMEMGSEMHIFLMDAEAFRSGRHEAAADSEDCGTAQHYLLLDEFYRTGIWLGGAYPLWWLIPPDQEANYADLAEMLLEKRFIKPKDYIDFGGCARIPPNEFVGAGMWQLYKGIDSPYKSVLKLMLVESYAKDEDTLPNLSLAYKQAIFADTLDPNELDPYVMVYRRLEQSLQSQREQGRLDLVRRSFYLKIGERLSVFVPEREKSWRRKVMEKLTHEWEWSERELRYLDGRSAWKVDQVIQEKRAVVNELTGCYRFLSSYAREKGLAAAISARDINLLGRKLYAAFQRKAGKVEMINPGIAPNLSEDNLAFHHLSSQAIGAAGNGWLLYRNLSNPMDAAFNPAVKRSNSLIELLVWAYCNGLLDRSTSVSLASGESHASQYELQQIISSLRSLISLPLPAVTQQDYRAKARLRATLVYVNVGVDPMADLSRRGLHKLSNRNDALGYASERANLVVTLDQVIINSWNEVMVQRYESGDTLVQCLKNYLAALAESEQFGEGLPQLSVLCYCPTRAGAIAQRVSQLFQQVVACYFSAKERARSRYILQMEDRYFVLQFVDDQPRFTALDDYVGLCEFLAQPQKHYSSIVVDDYALSEDVLRAVFVRMRPHAVQVFYLNQGRITDIYVIDEKGSLLVYRETGSDLNVLLGSLKQFLLGVQERKQMHDSLADDGAEFHEVEFYQLQPGKPEYRTEKRDISLHKGFGDYVEIQAIGAYENGRELDFNLYCEHKEFTVLEHGGRVAAALAHYLSSRFRNSAALPGYIIDLSLPHDLEREEYQSHLQTTQYLQYKVVLEREIRAARTGGGAVSLPNMNPAAAR